MKRKSILWISRYAAYDTVRHAGGQNFNYYLKRMSKEDFDISMVAFCYPDEKPKLDCQKYGIDCHVYCIEDECSSVKQKIIDLEMRYSPFNRHGNFCDKFVSKKIIEYVKSLNDANKPNIVILHWTETVLLAKELKKILPKAKFIAIEEDVAFLGLQRSANSSSNKILRILKYIKYRKLKKEELTQLTKVDIIFSTNHKDKTLLMKNGIKEIHVLYPYFHNMSSLHRTNEFSHIILFYGAMNREENYKAAIWFIENVFENISNEWHFYVVGNNPNTELAKYNSERIHITGYVDSIEPYFMKANCFVAPLLTGAGIKIKVLEAMSTGIPVITNAIGIEGIVAEDKIDYYHCSTPKDYITVLNYIETNYQKAYEVGESGKNKVINNFNCEKSFFNFREIVRKISD